MKKKTFSQEKIKLWKDGGQYFKELIERVNPQEYLDIRYKRIMI